MKSKIKEKIIYIGIIIVLLWVLISEVRELIDTDQKSKESKQVIVESVQTKNEIESIQKSLARKYKNDSYMEKSSNPYIPEGFKYVEGIVDTGYVIEDEKQNQFVWVPCSGNEKERNFIQKYYFLNEKDNNYLLETYDSLANEFLESIYTFGGFYIGRYETGIENNEPVIKYDKVIYSEKNYNEAKEIAEKMYENNKDIKSGLLNMYAYDVAANWCFETEDLTIQKVGEFSRDRNEDEKYHTGFYKINNIYDLIDNIWEYSTETYYDFKVCRGTEYGDRPEITRYPVSEEFISENLTFRVILYKENLT